MLKKLRKKKTAKRIWIILAILIIPAFVFWGIGGAMRSRQNTAYIGRISGRKVSFLEYKDALDAVKNQAVIQFGDRIAEVQKYLNLQEQAWERLLILQEAKIRRINASDKEVVELIEAYPFFQRNAKFDNKAYTEILRYVFRTQPRIFEEQVRQNIIISKLYKQVTDNISVDQGEIKKEYRKLNEEISLYYIWSSPSDFTSQITPSEQDIKDYFAKNSLQFKQPISFNLEYIASESEEKVKQLSKSINNKTDFKKIAQGAGLNVKETGTFSQVDPIPNIGWMPEISSLIAKLKNGAYTPPISMNNQYYIFRLKERNEALIPELKKIENQVKEALIKEKSTELAKAKTQECLKRIKGLCLLNPRSADLTKIAKEFALKYSSTALFKYGTYVEGIGASDALWIAARDLKEDQISEVLNMPSGFYIVKIKQRIPVDEKKFEDEKKEFAEKILLYKKQEYFAKFLEGLKGKGQ